ncbi:hypothetical protein [Virgibacillus proomii]|jgi:hypothetical protein|uniref:hypothetical protein n=1 Tax=Virgibacillus proomii TaxID=84407 RepID=UPI00117F2181|nr:hypothetical protein [Virgibacillus proomii]
MFATSLAHYWNEKNTDPYIRDKVKLHSVKRFLHGILVEPIGHLGAVSLTSTSPVFTSILKGETYVSFSR